MRRVLLAVLIAMAGVGCSHPEEEIKPAQILNPGGKPRTEQEATIASGQRAAGESASARMAESAAAMKKAQEQSGQR